MLRRLFRRCTWLAYFVVSLSVATIYWKVVGFESVSDPASPEDGAVADLSGHQFLDSDLQVQSKSADLEKSSIQPGQPVITDPRQQIDASHNDYGFSTEIKPNGDKTASDIANMQRQNPAGKAADSVTPGTEEVTYPQEKKHWKFSAGSDTVPVINSGSTEYKFIPYVATEDELEGKDTMDYVKGLGYWYIYNNDTYVDHEFNANVSMKTILLWNSFYDDADYKFGIGHHPFKVHFCIVNKCRTTVDRAELKTADMVIFFIFGLDFTKPNTIPPRGHPNQLYVFWNHESPFYKTRNKLRRFRHMFNLTVSYRFDSSIPLPLYQTRARVQRKLSPLVAKYHLRNKKKLAVWMISACHKIGSLRLPYERQLETYMPIDTYGACGNITCPMNETQLCLEDMEKHYKFYLAFENSMCRDYITEKAYRTLYGNWVPVVMGAGDYNKHLPPHSFIDVRDFESPRHLAQYLLYLDQNDEEYLKYFAWKKDWIVWRVHTKVALCELCEVLHMGSDKVRPDLDVHEWWEVQGECVKPESLPKFLKLRMMN